MLSNNVIKDRLIHLVLIDCDEKYSFSIHTRYCGSKNVKCYVLVLKDGYSAVGGMQLRSFPWHHQTCTHLWSTEMAGDMSTATYY